MHKHKLKLVRIPGITYRFKCEKCDERFVFFRSSIRTMFLRGDKYKPTYLMGNW